MKQAPIYSLVGAFAVIFTAALLVLSILVVIGWVRLSNTASTTVSNEQALKTQEKGIVRAEHVVRDGVRTECVIQARGLRAQHLLTDSLAEIHVLLTMTPTTKTPQSTSAKERQERRRAERILGRLDRNLAAYVKIERAQPSNRRCG